MSLRKMWRYSYAAARSTANRGHPHGKFWVARADSDYMFAWVKRIAALLTTILLTLAQLHADGPKGARDLADVSLEDLMNIEVTTVSKKEQKLSQAPAAIFV